MTSAAIVQAAAADGVRLALTEAGTLKTIGHPDSVQHWLPRLREHKAEIVQLLAAANDPTAAPATGWLIHFADRDPLEVWFSPAVTHGEVLAAHPAALAAEPIPERDIRKPTTSTMTTASCKTCRHRKRPGLSAGYCSGRGDLPGAYGVHHPLRKLPADMGEGCASYQTFEE